MSNLTEQLPQLEMLWFTHERVTDAVTDAATDASRPDSVAATRLPLNLAPGYTLRIFRPQVDDDEYIALMQAAGFEDWHADRLTLCKMTALPDGWFVIVDDASGALAATAMATHRPTPAHPFGGELGWVAAHPAHRGRKLGWTVCAAATNRLLDAGYKNIYLKTDDFRAPAILTYLRMGYLPFFYTGGMGTRWQTICTLIDWPYTPQQWPVAEVEARET